MKQALQFLAFVCALGILSCSGLKLNKDSNCLNDKSACFKNDVTPPQLRQSVYPVQMQLVSVLTHVDLMFTEELNNPQPSDFIFSGLGQDLVVNSVQKLNDYTYRLGVTQRTLVSGNIYLDFSNVRDYNGNKLQGTSSVTYIGNIDIPVLVPSVDANDVAIVNPTHLGINGTNYATLDITWQYIYTPPATNPGTTVYSVWRTTGSTDCKDPAATNISSGLVSPSPAAGAVTSYDSTNAGTRAATTHKFTLNTTTLPFLTAPAKHTILICVDNDANNKHGKYAIELVSTNVAPTTTISLAPGGYSGPRTMTLACSPYVDKIAYRTNETTDGATDPGLALTPAPSYFNSGTGALTAGTLYSSSLQTGYSGDPTWSAFQFTCIDLAGNIETVQTKKIYKVDSRIPTVNFISLYKGGTTTPVSGISQSGNYQSVDITFRTNQIQQQWEIRTDGAACNSGGATAASGAAGPATGTPATANAPFTKTIAYNAGTMSTDGVYTITLCVYSSTTLEWGQDTFTLIRDNSVPVITMNVAGGNFGAQQNVVPSCASNADKIMYTSATLAGGTAPTTPTAPVFDVPTGTFTSGTLFTGPLSTPDASTTTYVFVCLNKGGRLTAAPVTQTYKIDSILPTVSVVSNSRDNLSNATGYTTTTLVWQSSRGGLAYYVKQPGTVCNGANLATGTNLTGTTPVDTSQTVTSIINVTNFAADGDYDIQICVQNFVNQWGYVNYKLKRDLALPTISNAAGSITTIDATNFTLSWVAASDNNSIAGYRIFYKLVADATYPTNPQYTAISSPANIQFPDVQKYLIKIVPFDIAGNVPTTPANYDILTNKPAINIVVSGNTGNFDLTDGSQAAISVSASIPSWTTNLTIGQTYNFTISTQPAGQVCSIKEKQFGTFSSDVTITINCATGVMVGGRYQAIPAAPLNFMMYRGNVSLTYTAPNNVSGIAMAGNFVYFVQRDNVTDSSIRKCNPSSCAGTLSTVVNQTTGAFRHLATDGTNLYVTRADGTSAAMRVYKYSAIDTAQTAPAAEYDLGLTTGYPSGLALDVSRQLLYVGLRNVAEIRRVRLDNGTVTALTSVLSHHEGLAFLGDDLYIATPDTGNCILKAANAHAATSASVYAGSCGGTEGYLDGSLLNARFARIHGIVSDGSDLYLTEFTGQRIRRVNVRKGIVSTLAGSTTGTANGTGIAASFNSPFGMATDGRALYVSDGGGRLRKIADGGLLGYWPVATGSPEYDYNGSASPLATSVTGTLSSTATDRYGTANNAPRFTGAQTIASPSGQVALTATCDVTLAAWYKNDSLATHQGIVYNGNSGTSGYGIIYRAGEGIKILAGSVGLLPGATAVKSYMPVAGEWAHVAARCRGSNIWTLFINGKKYFELPFTANPPSAAGAQLMIGRDSASAFLNGSVADVRLYNRPLNEGEINELAQDASSSAAVTGVSFNKGATGLLSHYEIATGALSDSGALNYPVSGTGSPVNGKDGDPNGAYSFNIASTQYLATTNNTLDGTGAGGEITVAAWVSPATLPLTGAVHLIASRYSAADTIRGYYLEYFNNAGTQQLYWASSGGTSAYSTNITMPLNTWSHVAVTHSGTTATIYVNGQAMPTTQISPRLLTPTPNSTPIYIGRRDDGNHTNGKIDDVRVYNNALNAWQIRELATQVPAGLVGRYDFSGDRSDISGYGQDLSNNGVTLTTDRFGMGNAAALFNGSANFSGTTTNYPLGNSPRTICAWSKPTALFNGVFSEVVMYGANSPGAGWGFGMDATGGLPNGRIFLLNTVSDTIYANPHGLNIWRHICATYDGATEQLILDGTVIGSKVLSLSTASSSMVIGRGIFGTSDYFNGSIDDVRIYNRVLTTGEMQALQQQPNKRIYVTNNTYSGDLRNGGAGTGIAGADIKCNAADANKPATGTYKAMLSDGVNRRACTSAYCTTAGITENIDWVLRPNITYTTSVGDLRVFTADWNASWNFLAAAPTGGNFVNPIITSASTPWTGMTFNWAPDAACGNWDGIATSDDKGVFGRSNSSAQPAGMGGVIYESWTGLSTGTFVSCLASAYPLYCVEQ